MGPPPASTVGARLREAREKRGLPLRRIAERTRISVMALEALERDDVKRLPGGIFTRSFVRAYAAEVGLDPTRTVEDFLSQFPHEGAARRPAEDADAVTSDRHMAQTVVRVMLFSLPLVGLVIYFGGRQRLQLESRSAVRPAVEAGVPSSATVAAPAESVANASQAPASLAADSGLGSEPAGALTLVVAPQRDCWVSITVDGAKTSSGLVKRGERREATAQRDLELTVGDGAACAYTLNGISGRPFGAAGQVVTRRINRENYRNFQRDR